MAEYHEVTAQLLTTQLVQAAETGDVALLRALLTDHHDLALHGDYSFIGPDSRTLLHIACMAGARESVVEILKAGADPNAVDEYGSTPLHLTISAAGRQRPATERLSSLKSGRAAAPLQMHGAVL